MALRVYVCLGNAGNNPTFEEIAKLTGCYRSQVQRGIAWLEKHGWISITHRHCLGNQYKIHDLPPSTTTNGNTTSSGSTTSSGPTALTSEPEAVQAGTDVAPSDPDSSPLPSSPKDGSSKKKKTKSDPLFSAIKEAFVSTYDTPPSWNWNIQGPSINRIIKRCRTQPDPEGFAQSVMEAYWTLIHGNDKFWKVQPFSPKALNAEGIWTRVVKSMEEEPGLDIEAIVREATCRSTK